jgi:hypothetical protein
MGIGNGCQIGTVTNSSRKGGENNMSNKNSLIDEAIEILREVRVEVHGDVEDRVGDQLDEAILKLEETSRTRQGQIANQEALELLGKAIKWLPAVAKLIELLRDRQ